MPYAYVNGHYVDESTAQISIFDRGFLFGDGVYEVIAVMNGRFIDADLHYDRLARSLSEIQMRWPQPRTEIEAMAAELIAKNQVDEGLLYLQVTRGSSQPRLFNFPPDRVQPAIVAFTQAKVLGQDETAEIGIKVVTTPDLRWQRRDIKATALLAQCLAKQAAVEAGAAEALMLEDGIITEGSSSTFHIIKDNTLITRPLSHKVLPGVTRRSMLKLAADTELEIIERPISIEEAYAADEAFITSASTFVMPVVHIDGHGIANGEPGRWTQQLRRVYIDTALCASD